MPGLDRIASGDRTGSDVAVSAVAQDRITLDQLPDAGIERVSGPVSCGLDLVVGDDIVSLVGILADGSLEEDEARELLADLGAQLQLREVGVAQADVISLIFHGVESAQG